MPGRSAALLAGVAAVALATLLPGAPAAARSTGARAAGDRGRRTPRRGARDVLALIRKGGPFRYDRDGVTFGNREQLLPAKPRGYYREYTVPHARA